MMSKEIVFYSSDRCQDRWALEVLGFKRNGFFLDLAAAHPIINSNTYAMESQLNWKGICIERNHAFDQELRKHRTCTLSNDVINSDFGEVDFVFASEIGGI